MTGPIPRQRTRGAFHSHYNTSVRKLAAGKHISFRGSLIPQWAVRNWSAEFWRVSLGAVEGRDGGPCGWQKFLRRLDVLELKSVRKWI